MEGVSVSEIVSVIIPVYNAERHLSKCIGSITGQTHSQLDVIVIDDGSTDRSSDIAQAFADRDPRVRYLRQPNAGVSAARNAGLEIARGDYVSFVDADDWLEPDTFAKLVHEMLHHNADFVVCDYFVDHDSSSRIRAVKDRFYGEQDTAGGIETILGTHNRFAWSRLFARDLIGTIRFRTDLHWGEDTVFVIEVAKRARSSFFLNQALYHYVQSADSATRSIFNPRRLSGLEMTDVLEELVRVDYPQFVDFVVRTRINIVGELISDMFAAPDRAPTDQVPKLRARLRQDLPRILRSRVIPARGKGKALVMLASPAGFASAHTAHVNRIRRGGKVNG